VRNEIFLILVTYGVITVLIRVIRMVIIFFYFPRYDRYLELTERRKIIGEIRKSINPCHWGMIESTLKQWRLDSNKKRSHVEYDVEGLLSSDIYIRLGRNEICILRTNSEETDYYISFTYDGKV
jgi:hypothetical protein